MGGRQDLAHHVEHGVVIQSVADLLELLVEALQHPSLDGVGCHEIEDQAIVPLAVAMDAAHALLQPVRVPRDVVVEEDVAALRVDAFASRLGGHQDLDARFGIPQETYEALRQTGCDRH